MPCNTWKYWTAAVISAGLLELPFPLAGPMLPWRGIFAWCALAPLIWAVLRAVEISGRPLRSGFLVAYLCGFLWYMGNCYWVRDTMSRYGDMPFMAPTLLLVGFSLVLGLYFGLFGLALALVRRSLGLAWTLLAAPFLWVALELAAARATSVPWDQLGYSQIDNALLTQLAPFTGVYGISFVLVAANALLAWVMLGGVRSKLGGFAAGLWILVTGFAIILSHSITNSRPLPATTATAVLVQPNLDVAEDNVWPGPQWDQHIAQFTKLAGDTCTPYIAGIPQTGAPTRNMPCPPNPAHPDLVVWPESPAPFVGADPRFQQSMARVAQAEHAPLVIGGIGADFIGGNRGWLDYNSAMLFAADGSRIGRYDKIHLVPFGEYVPFKNFLTFAHKLTGRVSDFSRGTERRAFRITDGDGTTHRYGVFICYEAVFADEVRHFARNGAEVLVNISDDGWYGDTSAPWQHLNMVRMRAVENRRWILRDTNNGVTAAIDPYGRVRQSIPRHQVDALPAQYGFRDDVTFYTEHGDVFAWLCAILSIGLVVWALQPRAQLRVQIKVRS